MTEEYRHLYIHVPFCGRRCSYCDFSIAVRREVQSAAYVENVVREVEVRTNSRRPELTGIGSGARQGRPAQADLEVGAGSLDTIYLGGGTPSKLPAIDLDLLLRRLAGRGLSPAPGAELSLEANPEDLTPAAASAWRATGFNRLSIGVQSFDPGVLAWMHRTHSAEASVAAVQTARTAGFENISVDLIYALPERLGRDWDRDLDRALELGPEHLSVYGLTVEPRTPLGKWTARGVETPESDDRAAEQFLAAHDRLTKAGYEHYEVSSYARPGHRSRHNSSYWARVPYLGLGPSAHSFDGTRRRWNTTAFAVWERIVETGGDPIGGEESLALEQVSHEEFYLGLRTSDGLEMSGANLAAADAWVQEGWALREGNRIRLSPEGWLRMDALVASLDA